MTTQKKEKQTDKIAKKEQELTLVSQESLDKFNVVQEKIIEMQQLEQNEMSQMAIAAAKANIIAELKKALTDDMVKNIKNTLENNRLGFKTDKDDGYPIQTVRTALIEAAIDGFYWHGNEFNIIGGNAYYTKEGFTNKIKRTGDFTDVIINFSIPTYDIPNKRAIIKVEATWRYKNKPMEISKKFPIKLTIDRHGKNWSTDDAIIGKAERKIKAKMYEESTGTYFPEADADEIEKELKFNNAIDVEAKVEEEVKENANKETIDINLDEEPKDSTGLTETEKEEIERKEKEEAEKQRQPGF